MSLLAVGAVWHHGRARMQGRHRRLTLLAEGVEEDMHRTLKTNGGALQRLLPIQRALTEIQHDVKEAREAVESVVDSDAALNAVPPRCGRGEGGGGLWAIWPSCRSSCRVGAPVRARTSGAFLCSNQVQSSFMTQGQDAVSVQSHS